MTEKRKNIVTLCLLGAFLFGFGVWSLVRTADEFSLSERRPLQQAPQLSMDSVLSGEFMKQAELYSTDQFPLREQWRTLKAVFSYYVLGQTDNNGVYLVDGSATQLDYPFHESSVDYSAGRFQALYDKYFAGTDAKLYLSVVPDKNYFLADSVGAPVMDYDALIDRLRAQTEEYTYVDIFDLLSADDYYTTDSHWRQECLIDVAQRLSEAMGADSAAQYTENTLDIPYYGVYYGYAALPMPADTIRYLTSPTLNACTVYHYETDKTSGVYDLEKAAGKDPYELFLSGSESLLRVENPSAKTDRELIVFRDSFGSSLTPLLVEGYAAVTLVDIRYLSPELLGRYLTITDQDVLLLYSTSVLNNSEALK